MTMDTNLVNQLLSRMSPQTNGQTVLIVVAMVIAALGPVIAAVSLYFTKRSEVTVEKIHVAVNSERTATLAALKAMSDENLRLSKENSTMREHERGRDVAEALKAQQPKQ